MSGPSWTTALSAGKVAGLPLEAGERDTAKGVGPRATLRRIGLAAMPLSERGAWVEESRLNALLGNSLVTRKSVRSGISCYITFAGVMQAQPCWYREAFAFAHQTYVVQGSSDISARAGYPASLVEFISV